MLKLLVLLLTLTLSIYTIDTLLKEEPKKRKRNNHVSTRPMRLNASMIIDLTEYAEVEYFTKEDLREKILNKLIKSDNEKLDRFYDKDVCLQKFKEQYNLLANEETTKQSSYARDIPSLVKHRTHRNYLWSA